MSVDKLQQAITLLTDHLLDNTDDHQGFEEIPDIDEARTLLMEIQEAGGC